MKIRFEKKEFFRMVNDESPKSDLFSFVYGAYTRNGYDIAPDFIKGAKETREYILKERVNDLRRFLPSVKVNPDIIFDDIDLIFEYKEGQQVNAFEMTCIFATPLLTIHSIVLHDETSFTMMCQTGDNKLRIYKCTIPEGVDMVVIPKSEQNQKT